MHHTISSFNRVLPRLGSHVYILSTCNLGKRTYISFHSHLQAKQRQSIVNHQKYKSFGDTIITNYTNDTVTNKLLGIISQSHLNTRAKLSVPVDLDHLINTVPNTTYTELHNTNQLTADKLPLQHNFIFLLPFVAIGGFVVLYAGLYGMSYLIQPNVSVPVLGIIVLLYVFRSRLPGSNTNTTHEPLVRAIQSNSNAPQYHHHAARPYQPMPPSNARSITTQSYRSAPVNAKLIVNMKHNNDVNYVVKRHIHSSRQLLVKATTAVHQQQSTNNPFNDPNYNRVPLTPLGMH